MLSRGTALILHFGTRCQKHRLNGSSCWSDFLMKIRSTGHLFEYLPFCKRLKPAISDRSVLQHKSCHLQLDFCCHAPPHTQGVGGIKMSLFSCTFGQSLNLVHVGRVIKSQCPLNDHYILIQSQNFCVVLKLIHKSEFLLAVF